MNAENCNRERLTQSRKELRTANCKDKGCRNPVVDRFDYVILSIAKNLPWNTSPGFSINFSG